MSSLFIRLVRQTLGQPRNPVHNAVSIPFQLGPEVLPCYIGNSDASSSADIFETKLRTGFDGQPSSADVGQPAASARMKSTTVTSAEKTPGPSTTRLDIESAETDRPVASPLLDGVGEAVSQQLIDPALSGVRDTQFLLQTEPVDSKLPPSSRTSSELFTDPPPGGEPPRVVEAGQHKQPLRQGPLPTGLFAPAPLLPPVASPAMAGSAAAVQMATAASNSPNEVHVHIGRIEVIALQPEAAPKPKPRAARQPMSLADYLDRGRQN